MLIVSLLRLVIMKSGKDVSKVFAVAFLVIGLLALGMYEANAIQFGMDQMLEASSEQLSSFIHWYFWCAHVGALAMVYITMGVFTYSRHCKMKNIHNGVIYFLWWASLASACVQVPVSVLGVIACTCYAKKFPIQQISRQPLRNISAVLKYSYHHKYPERRSAFTYWENDIPSRIDLGMHKYGGPFTYEQVQDVKTIFQLLLVMLSLFGYQLSGDGYSVSVYVMNTAGCPTLAPLLGFLVNPQHISFLIVLIGVPIFKTKKLSSCRRFNLLSRIWIGLFICLVNEALQCAYSILLPEEEFDCPQVELFNKSIVPPVLKCLSANTDVFVSSKNVCVSFCNSHPITGLSVNLSVLIILLHGLAYVLVFSTMLEFICAQSPNETKGLLVGMWYSMLFVKSSIVNVVDTQVTLDTDYWNVYHGVKGFGIFLSMIAFSFVCKKYRYRERNEIVCEQAIIEEQYERELLLNSSSNERYRVLLQDESYSQ